MLSKLGSVCLPEPCLARVWCITLQGAQHYHDTTNTTNTTMTLLGHYQHYQHYHDTTMTLP